MSALDAVAPTKPVNSRPQSREPSQPLASSPLVDVPPSTTQNVVTPAPEAALTQDIPQSQSMTTSISASSLNQNPDDGDTDSAPTYGTRSRNRPGATRPNYADDKELDMEIEAAGRMSKAASKKLTTSNTQTAETTPAPMGFAAISSVSIPNGEPAAHTDSPGPAPAPSKKRKQPGSNHTSSATTPAHVLGPRSKPHQSAAYVETNMMSFSRCGSKLNSKKQLVADDGTILAANGQPFPPSLRLLLTNYRARIPHLRTSWRTLLPCSHHGVSSCWQRSYCACRCNPCQLVLPTKGHWKKSSGYKSCLRFHAFRYLPVGIPSRQVQHSTSEQYRQC
jgi:hypothetical protein